MQTTKALLSSRPNVLYRNMLSVDKFVKINDYSTHCFFAKLLTVGRVCPCEVSSITLLDAKRMKTTIILVGLSLIVGCTSLTSSKQDDGYALYTRACEHHDTLDLRNSPAEGELLEFLDKGGIPGTHVIDLIKQEQNAFTLIQDAHSRQHWKLPDITTFSADTRLPYISSWLGINRAATAQAILLYRDGNPRDTLSFLIPFNTTGLRVSKAGTLIHILIHVACRSMQHPVLASSIDDLPEASLAEELSRAKEQYELIPTACESIAGDQHMAINTAKGLFSDLREQLKPNQRKMIQDLKTAGVEEKTLAEIEKEEVLSVADWENQVLSDLGRLQSFYTNALATRPSSELSEVDDEIEAEIEKIGSDVGYKTAMAAWNLYMTNQASGSFSMPDAKRLHSQVGKAISHQFLSMTLPAVGAFGIRYREFIASERLILIRLAIRVYAYRHGERPSTLQQLVDDQLLDGEMIMDPLSGKHFLTRNNGTFEPYSVGRDLDDDNGAPWDLKTKSGDTIMVALKEKWSVQQAKPSVCGIPRR